MFIYLFIYLLNSTSRKYMLHKTVNHRLKMGRCGKYTFLFVCFNYGSTILFKNMRIIAKLNPPLIKRIIFKTYEPETSVVWSSSAICYIRKLTFNQLETCNGSFNSALILACGLRHWGKQWHIWRIILYKPRFETSQILNMMQRLCPSNITEL
jgi:hypothetical protein